MFQSLTTPKKRNNKTSQHKNNNNNKQNSTSTAANTSSSLLSTTTSTTSSTIGGIGSSHKIFAGTTTSSPSDTTTNNERLQRDKLDVIIRQQQHQNRRQRSITPRESSAAFCNTLTATTAIVDCCRDVNCRFNALQCTTETTAAVSTENGGLNFNNVYNCESSTAEKSSSSPIALSSACYSSVLLSTANKISNTSNTNTTTATSKDISRLTAISKQRQEQQQQKQQTTSDVASTSLLIWNWLSSLGTRLVARLLNSQFTIHVDLDIFSWILFFLAFCTRFYRLATPAHIVFDELHYGKYVSHYMRHMFFFDQHPPLGKQLIAAVAHLAGDFNGNATFSRIGAAYGSHVPIFWLRFLPALCGSLLAPIVYKLLLEAGLKRWTSLLGGLFIIFDNALLTQSRFILMESMLLLFSTLGLYSLLHFQRCKFAGFNWLLSGLCASILLTCATSVKYAGFFTFCLAIYLMCRYLWDLLYDCDVTDFQILMQTVARIFMFTVVPLTVYLSIFYIHLKTLNHAGPHDSAMTSAFQASLEGGLASITRGQPLNVVHGSQITLRHTHGRTCWLHSHNHVYPVRYPDKRGSSHQQQVTCYSFKDVNNWWIVKRPERDELVVGDEPDIIRDGDIIQLVHGITSRALNSHDVAAPLTPQCQEVSCYIDYNIKMEPEMLWRVEILNKDAEGDVWHAIKSQIRLIHTSTGAALRFSGRQLPDWGFNQHEVVADRVIENQDAIWNVEEHRYTKTHDERERERQLLNAEMLPTKKTVLSFWDKFIELQTKMLWNIKQVQSHMYSSEPIEWPLLDKGIAYWVDNKSNGQIHLLGNILIWYTATVGVLLYAGLGIFYMIRRRRLCYDLETNEWQRFLKMGDLFFLGYLFHYLPYFLMDRTLFLHNYLPALVYKMQLLCYVIEHIDYLLKRFCKHFIVKLYRFGVLIWFLFVVWVFWRFIPLSYGFFQLTTNDVIGLRWKDTWDFILQKEYQISEKSLEIN